MSSSTTPPTLPPTAALAPPAARPGSAATLGANDPRSALSGHLALVAVQFCFGLFALFTLLATRGGFVPRQIASWRVVVGSVVFGLGSWWVYRSRFWPARRDLPKLVLAAILGVVLNQLLALEGVARSTSTNAGLIMTLIPVFTFTIAAGVGQERLSLRRLAGVPIAMTGAAVVVLGRSDGGVDLGGPYLTGNLLMASNCLCYACYLVLVRPMLARMPSMVLLGWVYLLSLPVMPWIGGLPPSLPSEVSAEGWWGFVGILVVTTVLAYGLNTFALARVPASVTTIYIYLQPLIAAGAGVWILDEELGPELVPAAILLFAGIALVTWPARGALSRASGRSAGAAGRESKAPSGS